MSPLRREQPTVVALEHELADVLATSASTESERDRLALVLDMCRDGVVVVDADGNEVYRNAAAERYREARHADAVAAGNIAALLEEARRGLSCERELGLFGPPRAMLQLHAVPLREGVRIVGAAVFVYDVSDIHRIESVRRDFVANVSHELKTPIGALEVLAETMAAESDPAVTGPLAERMVREAERLGRIVDDLLNLSLIESQESPIRDPMPLDALVNEAVDRVRPAAIVSGIELRADNGAPSALVACDRRQVVSAITNLVDNAIKYSEPGSAVDVSSGLAGDNVVVTVKDVGIGIPSRDLQRIFERFYRVDQARSRATGGTGLGLAIVGHVAQAHGGEVTVESVEGQGSTFRFTLPLAVVDTTTDVHGDERPAHA
jgi:two-component system, OmpR family, sensor histidine kinase SenX3